MPRLPPVEKSPHARLRATLCPGVGYSVVDFIPIAFQFLGHHLRKAGKRALSHLGARNANHDGVIRTDHDPCGDFRRAISGARDAVPKGRLSPNASPLPTAAEPMMNERRLKFGVSEYSWHLPYALAAA